MRVLSRPAVNTVDGCGGSGLPPDKQGNGGTELPAKVAHLSKGQPGGDGTGRGGDFVSVSPLSKSFRADFYFFFFFLLQSIHSRALPRSRRLAHVALLLIQRRAYIHTRELCGTISSSAVCRRAAAPEQVAAKCFSKEHSKGALSFFFSSWEIITIDSHQPISSHHLPYSLFHHSLRRLMCDLTRQMDCFTNPLK